MTDTVEIGGQKFGLADLVPWELAEAEGGFYFSRAKHLGLPQPPAAFVADSENTDEAQELISQYHILYSEAEAEVFSA